VIPKDKNVEGENRFLQFFSAGMLLEVAEKNMTEIQGCVLIPRQLSRDPERGASVCEPRTR
jgi:hypothetical protein